MGARDLARAPRLRRHVWVGREADWLTGERRFPGELRLPGAMTIVKVRSRTELEDRCRTDTRKYISSAALTAQAAAAAVRGHWGIENRLHWVLDVVFGEDQARRRSGLHGMPTSTKLTGLSSEFEGAMLTVNIHDAKTHLSRLIDRAAKGEPFIIAKAGRPMVKVTAMDAPTPDRRRRLGFLAGQIAVPDDFDRMGDTEIHALFEDET